MILERNCYYQNDSYFISYLLGLVSKVVPKDKVRTVCIVCIKYIYYQLSIVIRFTHTFNNLLYFKNIYQILEAALEISEKISSFSRPSVAMAKEAINASFELSLQVKYSQH